MSRSMLVVCVLSLVTCSGGGGEGEPGDKAEGRADVPSIEQEELQPEEGWRFVQALASLYESGPMRMANGVDALAMSFTDSTPEAVRTAVGERVMLVPYTGSFVDPERVRNGAKLNTLDRALYMKSVLEAAGYPARIVFNDVGREVTVGYSKSGPAPPITVPQELRSVLVEDVDALLPALWAEVQRHAPQWIEQGGAEPEQEVFWVQVQESGSWSDLLFEDTSVTSTGSRAARVLTEEALSERTWRIAIRVEIKRGEDSSEVLDYDSTAADLHALPMTYFHRPEGSLASLTPVLLVGDRVYEGLRIEDHGEANPIEGIWLDVELNGPGQKRQFIRRIVGPRPGGVTDEERRLQLAPVVRLTVVTTHLSDLDHAAILEGTFAQVAAAMFQGWDDGGAQPLNLASLRAVALLGAAEQLAGTGSEELLVYRGRPALVLEKETLVGMQEGLYRVESMDFLEPGTTVFEDGASREEISRAALASSIVEARLEDWLSVGDDVVTSFERVEGAIDAGLSFSPSSPADAAGMDVVDEGKPMFVTIGGQDELLAGLRLTRGPAAVFVLGDRSGGASVSRPIDRVRSLCEPLEWSALLVPLRAMPYSWLVGPIVAYNCRLAEAYNTAANVLDNLFAEDEPGDGAEEKIEDLERQIHDLGPDLLADLAAWAALNGFVHGLLTPVAEQFAKDVIAPLLSYVNKAGARMIPRATGRGSRISAQEAGQVTTRAAAREATEAAASMRASGMTADEAGTVVRNSTREGAETAAERVAAGESSEVVLLEGGSEAEAAAGRQLGEALERWYQREGLPYDRIHQTSVQNLREVGRTGWLRNPMTQEAANFSQGGTVGLGRQGGGAVRIRGGDLNPRIDFIETPDGHVARYWPDGTGFGNPIYDIPTSELEYFNAVGGEWVPFPPVGG